jgi:hypothetical protein
MRLTIIYLGRRLPGASSSLPEDTGEQPVGGLAASPSYLALLRVGFAEPARSPGLLVVSCAAFSP